MRLSARLNEIYSHLLVNQDVWDICCDHGYLGSTAYKSSRFKCIYFVDQVPSIMKSLETRFNKFVLKNENPTKVFFYTNAGQAIKQKVVGTVCISGVGATTITSILVGLQESGNLLAHRLILGPHKDEHELLDLFEQNSAFKNYKLSIKKIILENKKERSIYMYDLVI